MLQWLKHCTVNQIFKLLRNHCICQRREVILVVSCLLIRSNCQYVQLTNYSKLFFSHFCIPSFNWIDSFWLTEQRRTLPKLCFKMFRRLSLFAEYWISTQFGFKCLTSAIWWQLRSLIFSVLMFTDYNAHSWIFTNYIKLTWVTMFIALLSFYGPLNL